MVQGDNRVLTLVPTPGDGAAQYEVAQNDNSATGTYTLVHTFNAGQNLNTTVGGGAHWVRAKNGTNTSAWLQCDSYRKISFIDAVPPIDWRRQWASITIGLDGNGSSTTQNGYRAFDGQDDDIIAMSASNTAGLEPNGKKMAWRVKFRLATADLATLQAAGSNGNPNISWNIMQRGLASDPGGQWKMSVVSQSGSDAVRVQCVTGDGTPQSGGKMQVDSAFNITTQAAPINGFTPWITATCFADDSGLSQGAGGVTGDGLQVVVNGTTSAEAVFTGLGTITPSATGMCTSNNGGTPLDPTLFPNGIGSVVTVGNKPPCWSSNTVDDAFVGHIDYAEVFKQ